MVKEDAELPPYREGAQEPSARSSMLHQKKVDPRRLDELELKELEANLSRQEYLNEMIRKVMEVVPVEKERDAIAEEVGIVKAELAAVKKRKSDLQKRLNVITKDYAERELDLVERAMSETCHLLEGAGACDLAQRLREVRGPSLEALRAKTETPVHAEVTEDLEGTPSEQVPRRPSILNPESKHRKKEEDEEESNKKLRQRSESWEAILETAADSSEGHLNMGRDLIRQMERAGVNATAKTFHNLFRMCHSNCSATNWSDVETVLTEMKKKEIVPMRASWLLLLDICASANGSKLENGFDLLRHMKSVDASNIDSEVFLRLLKICSKQRARFASTVRVVDLIERSVPISRLDPRLVSETCLCYEYCPDRTLQPRLDKFFDLLPEKPDIPTPIELKAQSLEELHEKARANGIIEPHTISKAELVENLFQILRSQPRHTGETFAAYARALAKTEDSKHIMAILGRARSCLPPEERTDKLYRTVWRSVSGNASLRSAVEGLAVADGVSHIQLTRASSRRTKSPRGGAAKGKGKGHARSNRSSQ